MKDEMTMEDLDALEVKIRSLRDTVSRALARVLSAQDQLAAQIDDGGAKTAPWPKCPPNLPEPWPYCDGTMPALMAILSDAGIAVTATSATRAV